MKFLNNVSKNIFKAFPTPEARPAGSKVNFIEVSFSNAYEDQIPRLQEICLAEIARIWNRHPEHFTLEEGENKYYFLRELSGDNDLLNLTKFIKEDLFWEQQYLVRYGPRFTSTLPGKWLQVFMERHLKDLLETMKPSEYEEESMIEALELYNPYLETLTIHNWQPPPKHEIHHIPLDIVLKNLTELKRIDLSIEFKDTGDDFGIGCCDLSDKDIDCLASGIECCYDLLEFRLSGTKLSPCLAKRLGRSIEKCTNLRMLHIVDCKLSDEGVIAFLMGLAPDSLPSIEDVDLTNNFISSTGAFQLAIVLSRRPLKQLNLRLNPIKSDGACLLLGKLLNRQQIMSINFSACSLDPGFGVMVCKWIKECKHLKELHLAVNNFNDLLGWNILENLKLNTTLIDLDLRNTNLSPTISMLIESAVMQNYLRQTL